MPIEVVFDYLIEDDGEGEISIIAKNKVTGDYKDVGEISYCCEYCTNALFTREEAKNIALKLSCLPLLPDIHKYDPCRRFKAGDKVEVVANKGRAGSEKIPIGTLCTVLFDEEEYQWVMVEVTEKDGSLKGYLIDPAYLKLVTPINDSEVYHLETNQYGYHIENSEGAIIRTYNDETTPDVYVLAEADCKRLNTKYK